MKISVSAYSYNQYVKDGRMTQLDCVAKAAEMGFDGIEFTELKPCAEPTLEEQISYAKEIKAKADELGIAIVAYAIGAKLFQFTDEESALEVARVKGQLDVAAALGAKVVRHDVCYTEKYDGRVVSFGKMLPTIAKNAREITEYAKTLGIKTCTENHGFIAQDSDRVEALYNAVDSDNYGILVDVGNFACADEDSAHAVSRLANYAIHVHVKDFIKHPFGTGYKGITTRAFNNIIACVVGEGNIPVRQCLAILNKAGYDGYVSIEFEGAENCMEAVVRGKQNLEKFLAELA